jgi:uncharacterized membrane protein YtjA (UPF0391 family)
LSGEALASSVEGADSGIQAGAALSLLGVFNPEVVMLRWALIFLVLAIIAGFMGFGGVAATSAGIAKILFILFIIVFAVTLLMGLAAGRRPPVV